jgi:hypothetical protein
MRQVILLLITCVQQPQMLFGPTNMMLGRPPDPVIKISIFPQIGISTY